MRAGGFRGGAPEQRNFAVKIPCWRGQRRHRRRCLSGKRVLLFTGFGRGGPPGRFLLGGLRGVFLRLAVLYQRGKILVIGQRHQFRHPLFHGEFHGVAGQQHAIDAKAAFFLCRDGRGYLREQVFIGFDPALQVFVQAGLVPKTLALLPGDLTARASIIRFPRGVVGEIPR